MKMSQKLIILFSLLSVLTTAANSMYFYYARVEDLNESIHENLSALGNKMVDEIEQYVRLMDYALEQLTSNVDFMSTLHIACIQENHDDIGELVAAQNLMSRTLYQAPILENFYRVSVYSRNGFYLSNHFEITNSVTSLSDEARETVASLHYLSTVDENPFFRHLVGPHEDPWTSTRTVPVFSAVKAAIWRGQFIGYLEVSARVEELENIFYIPEMETLLVQAIFDDGTHLFRLPEDTVVYADMNQTAITPLALDDGSERLVIRLRSKSLGLNVFVAQDMSVYAQRVRELLVRYVTVAGVIILITLCFVILFSLGITRAVRRLTRKMVHLPVDDIMARPDEMLSTMVTNHFDKDIFDLEQVFNGLIARLQVSHQAEVSLREGALHAQLNALQMQINPHFVYNTLNIISAKGMESGNEEIIEICNQFAQMLRYSTDLHSRTATLGDELQNARRYLLLAKARYEDQLDFTMDVPEGIETLLIPKLTIQPIVENALTHGFRAHQTKREIAISGVIRQGTLCLTIRDNGGGFGEDILQRLTESFRRIEQDKRVRPDESGSHIGLTNTYTRLYYYSKGKMQMRLYNDGGAIVELRFPCREGISGEIPS